MTCILSKCSFDKNIIQLGSSDVFKSFKIYLGTLKICLTYKFL